MFGVSNSREPIKGEFAKKLVTELQRMLKLKKEGKHLHFENKDREIHHNITIEDEVRKEIYDMTLEDINYHRWLILTMKTPLEDFSLEDLRWASRQPYNSFTSENIFLEEIQRRMKLKN